MILVQRRSLLAAPALLALTGRLCAAAPGYQFTLGVASGEPTPDGMVLWTRLAPRPLEGDGGMAPRPVAVRWELAADERFARILQHGTAIADPAWGHALHVEPRGLAPDRFYWFRFIAGGEVSPVGRTRTAPARGARVDRLRFCYGSCQNFEVGHYAAHRDIAAQAPDLVLFLGDYIYEADPKPGRVRLHRNPEPKDVPGYRVRYATYKLDPDLQAAHQIAPWAVTWDDHEVANDHAGLLDENNSDPALFAVRRAAAYKAYWEHMPLRRAQRPVGDALPLYRTLDWGDLAQFQIVDDRQYRDPRACQPPELRAEHKPYQALVRPCAEMAHAKRSMLGAAQEAWLARALGATRARWNLLAQETLMTSLFRVDPAHPDLGPSVYSADTWSTYTPARDRIFRRWAEAATPNPVALGGDIHTFVAGDIHHPDRPDGPPIASEFVGGSISSAFNDKWIKDEGRASRLAFVEEKVKGHARVDLTRDRCDVTFRGVRDVTLAASPAYDLARFSIAAGKPGLQHA